MHVCFSVRLLHITGCVHVLTIVAHDLIIALNVIGIKRCRSHKCCLVVVRRATRSRGATRSRWRS